MRNDTHIPKPNNSQSSSEKAYSIFVERARAEGRNYFGDMVQSNLNNLVSAGNSPEEAVNKLFKQANRRR